MRTLTGKRFEEYRSDSSVDVLTSDIRPEKRAEDAEADGIDHPDTDESQEKVSNRNRGWTDAHHDDEIQSSDKLGDERNPSRQRARSTRFSFRAVLLEISGDTAADHR